MNSPTAIKIPTTIHTAMTGGAITNQKVLWIIPFSLIQYRIPPGKQKLTKMFRRGA
jgi:hypothetical protein